MTEQTDLYDLKLVKYHESLRNPEVIARIGLLTGAVGILVFWYDQPAVLLGGWLCWYLLNQMIVFLLVHYMPQRVGQRGKAALIGIYAIDTSAYCILPIWLWWQDDWHLRIFALCLLFGAMLHAVAFSSMTPLRRLTNGAFVLLGMVWMLAIWHQHMQDLKQLVALGFGMLALFLYFVFAIRQSLLSQQKLREAMTHRISNERVAAIGELTGGVAHDFNNLLTVIMGNVELARDIDDPHERRLLLDEAHAAGERGARLTSHLLSFSRKSVLQPEVVDLPTLLERNQDFLRRVLPSKIDITLHSTPVALPPLEVDVAKFETMLLNFVLNARDAMPMGGTIELQPGLSADGSRVTLTVTDTGVGMPKEVLHRVTEPFYTTKPVGKGTGLGLSMAKGFVEQSNGQLHIASQVGQGTAITIELPTVEAAPDLTESAAKESRPGCAQKAPRKVRLAENF